MLTAEIRTLSGSAAAAGRTKGLSSSSYRLFVGLVTAAAVVQAAVTPASDDSVSTLDTTTVGTLRKAVSAVDKHCDQSGG
ncbi:MAG: hypothetical protein JWP74_3650 [Marmoricola sp.]|nr:hypothetical protein [Marmoricola sp.]